MAESNSELFFEFEEEFPDAQQFTSDQLDTSISESENTESMLAQLSESVPAGNIETVPAKELISCQQCGGTIHDLVRESDSNKEKEIQLKERKSDVEDKRMCRHCKTRQQRKEYGLQKSASILQNSQNSIFGGSKLISLGSSLKSENVRASVSKETRFSDSQIKDIYKAMAFNRQQKMKIEKIQLQESMAQEEEEEEKRLNQEIEELERKKQHQMENFRKRKERQLLELKHRNQHAKLELDADFLTALAERGLPLELPPIVPNELLLGTTISVSDSNQAQAALSPNSNIAVITAANNNEKQDVFQPESNLHTVANQINIQCTRQPLTVPSRLQSIRVAGNTIVPVPAATREQGMSVYLPVHGFGKFGPQNTGMLDVNKCMTIASSVCNAASNLILNPANACSASYANSNYFEINASGISNYATASISAPTSNILSSAHTNLSFSTNNVPIFSLSQNYIANTNIPPILPNLNTEDVPVNMPDIRQIPVQPNSQVICIPQSAVLLPLLEPPVFAGDASEYHYFINLFKTFITTKTQNPNERLAFLLQYTTGTAHSLVKSYWRKGAEGYNEALKILEETYGHNFQIELACLNSIVNGPRLDTSSGESITKFVAELISCENTLEDVQSKGLSLIMLDKISRRMPSDWRSGWSMFIDNVIHVKHETLSLSHLTTYVRKKSREASNLLIPEPKFVSHKTQNSNKHNTKPHKLFATAAATADRPVLVCLKCSGNHYLNQCRGFRSMKHIDREKFVREHRLCFSCLNEGHWARQCRRENPCRIPNCKRKHATLLHPPDSVDANIVSDSETPNKKAVSTQDTIENDTGNELTAFVNSNKNDRRVLLNVIPVKVRVKGTNNIISTNAFFDNGSTCSFITESLMNKLNVTGYTTNLNISTITNISERKQSSVINDIELSDFDETEFIELGPLFSNKKIDIDSSNVPTQSDAEQFWEFNNVVIPKLNKEVGLLIGKDNVALHKPLEIIHGPSDHYAVRYFAGWVISRPSKNEKFKPASSFYVKSNEHPLCKMCTEVIDSIQNEKPEFSPNQQIFLERTDQSIHLTTDGHYEMDLPFKNLNIKLPINKIQAERRLQNLKRKFLREPDFYSEYKNFVKDMLDNGYAEEINDIEKHDGKSWYLSHHGVRHPEKQSLRVVFDCSAKFDELSLNDVLLQGPDLANNLVGVLARFRRQTVAIQGDIRAMFHQVKVSPKHRDYLKFLWWEDGDIQRPIKVFRMTSFLFGTICSPSCANLALKRTADDNKEQFDESTVTAVYEAFYVDDFLDSKSNTDEAISHIENVKNLVAKGGFEITKWVSNDREVMMTIPEEHRAKNVKGLDLSVDDLPVEKALGMIWDVEQDTLCFRVKYKEKPATKRGLLSVINSIFDPLGFGQPILQPMKVLIQQLCRIGLDWDDPIPPEAEKEWFKWLSNLPKLKDFSIPRSYIPSDFGDIENVELHHFSDASEKSYGVASYIRLTNSSGQVHCAILCGKTRLVPLSGSTIPRLELCAATIAARNDVFFRRELKMPIIKSFFWTDSITVLRYLSSTDKAFKTFVANRINTIKETSEINQWRYVPSQSNPADIASRGLTVDAFLKCQLWIKGPEFLWKSIEDWPIQPDFMSDINYNDPELKKQSHQCFANTATEPTFLDRAISKHSDWYRLTKTVAWILRGKHMLFPKLDTNNSESNKSTDKQIPPLSVSEITAAELEIVKYEQSKYFSHEIQSLSHSKELPKSSSLHNLHPFMKNGIIRVGGRINKAPVSYDAKHPIVIPNESPIASLVIAYIHRTTGHNGREYVLAELRQKYWIIKGNSLVRKIINTCVSCRRRQRKPECQEMSDLPEDRVTPDKPPFSFVALDCFGPYIVRQGRSDIKRYGVIFTCLTTRAIHVEIARMLDTDSFIMALRRFIARRGQVLEIRSDNGTNFVSAERELREALQNWNQNQIHEFLLQKKIKWIFQTPSASHHGGVFERQIRTVKKVFGSICLEQTLTEESLATLMCECESIINSRPITTVSNDPNDLTPLTPNDLLLLKQEPVLSPGLFDKKDVYSRKRWKQVQYLADVFWQRWRKEYLPLQQQRQKWNKIRRNICENDIVLVVDNNLPRNAWLLGRVIKTFPDKKGIVRSVSVQTQYSVLERPITKLVLLHACA